jgi:hypothetical protein
MNKHYNNVLLKEYNNHTKNNLLFGKNNLLSNNLFYVGSVSDPNFAQKLKMAKIEQFKKFKHISELNLNQNDLVKYIINPIEIEKLKEEKALILHDNLEATYPKYERIKNKNSTEITDKLIKNSKYLDDLHEKRTNMAYKNILKKENYNKIYKNKEDLIVHKITKLDKDKILLDQEYKNIKKIMKKQKNQIKLIYSKSEKNRFLEEFNYVQKYKYKLNYDPKNVSDLKKYYRKEQKKITSNTEKIDDLIDKYLYNAEFSDGDIIDIKKQLNISSNDDKLLDTQPTNSIKKYISENKKELKEKLGDDYYTYIKELESDSDDDVELTNDNKKNNKKNNKTDNKKDDKINNKKDDKTDNKKDDKIDNKKDKTDNKKDKKEDKEDKKDKKDKDKKDDKIDNIKDKKDNKIDKIKDNKKDKKDDNNKKKIIVRTKIIENDDNIGKIDDDLLKNYKNRK